MLLRHCYLVYFAHYIRQHSFPPKSTELGCVRCEKGNFLDRYRLSHPYKRAVKYWSWKQLPVYLLFLCRQPLNNNSLICPYIILLCETTGLQPDGTCRFISQQASPIAIIKALPVQQQRALICIGNGKTVQRVHTALGSRLPGSTSHLSAQWCVA